MAIKQTTISNVADTEIVSAPPSGSYANVGIFFCNHSAAAVTLQVYVLTAPGTAADSNSIMRDLVLQPKETFVLNAEKFLLGTNQFLVARASAANAVVATATYIAI
jgi:hypothetical protein